MGRGVAPSSFARLPKRHNMPENEQAPDTENMTSPFDLEESDHYSKYLLFSRAEMLFLLRALQQKGSMVTAHFDHGKSFFLTSLVEVDGDEDELIFDYGSNDEMNRRVQGSNKVIFTSALDKVKVQFSLPGLTATTHQGRPAFSGTLPESILRLQRREYFRLTTPLAKPLKCIIPVADGTLDTTVLDISGGGIGLMLPVERKDFPLESTFANCRLELPEEGTINFNMIVRNAFFLTNKSGHNYLRVGCEFDNLSGGRLAAIQRYITRIERERKARESGML